MPSDSSPDEEESFFRQQSLQRCLQLGDRRVKRIEFGFHHFLHLRLGLSESLLPVHRFPLVRSTKDTDKRRQSACQAGAGKSKHGQDTSAHYLHSTRYGLRKTWGGGTKVGRQNLGIEPAWGSLQSSDSRGNTRRLSRHTVVGMHGNFSQGERDERR